MKIAELILIIGGVLSFIYGRLAEKNDGQYDKLGPFELSTKDTQGIGVAMMTGVGAIFLVIVLMLVE